MPQGAPVRIGLVVAYLEVVRTRHSIHPRSNLHRLLVLVLTWVVVYAGYRTSWVNRVVRAHNFYLCYNQANAYGRYLGHLEHGVSAVFQTDFGEAHNQRRLAQPR